MLSPLPSAAAEHQLGSERGRGRRKRGTSVRQGESWPLRCTCILQMAGGCHWIVLDGTSLFLGPELQTLGVGLGALAPLADKKRKKLKKKPSSCHMFPWLCLAHTAHRWRPMRNSWKCSADHRIEDVRMSKCDDRRWQKQANTGTETETETKQK